MVSGDSNIPIRIVIQSRVSSSRLPAKALLPIANMPSIILCALRATTTDADVIVATSEDTSDDILVDSLKSFGIKYVRGPLNDVLGRYELSTKDLPPHGIVVRLTADNLFPDGSFGVAVARYLVQEDTDFVETDSFITGLPYGMSAEAFRVQVLREAHAKATNHYDREHVTPWIKKNFRGKVFRPDNWRMNLCNFRCTMDTLEDYLRIVKVFQMVRDPINVPWYELCTMLLKVPGESGSRIPLKEKNGLRHSEMVLGTAQLGMSYGIANRTGKPSVNEAMSIIRQSIAHGITSIDCARAYGDAESRVGKALTGGLSGQVNIITKLDPLEYLTSDETEKNVRIAVDASIFRSCYELRVQQLDTLLLHRWKHRFSHNGVVWKRLMELKDEGIIRAIGVSVQNPSEAIQALEEVGIDHIQLPFNILDWRWQVFGVDRLLAAKSNIVVHARSIFLQGCFTANASVWPNVTGVFSEDWIKKIDRLVFELGRGTRAELCLAYVRSKDWITSLVIGVETLNQLYQNINLFQKPPLTEEEACFLENSLYGAPENLLNPAKWGS